MLLDIKCAINNRPLYYQGKDPENEVITPNILLRGRPARLLEEDLQKLNDEDNVTKRLMYVKRCKEELQKRWMQEYLYALKEREKTCTQKQKKIPAVGSLVLLVEDTKNRGTWKTDIIQQEVHGKDRAHRGYKIKTGNEYIIECPLQMVCNLEFENKDNKVVKHKLNPDAEEYVPTTNVGPIRKIKDTALNRIVGISMEEEEDT